LRFGLYALDSLLRRLGFGHHRKAVPIVVLPDLGHSKTAGGALKQPRAKALLQQRHAPAQG
jgi:hypothetical protein